MAQSCLKARALHSAVVRPRRRLQLAVRAEGANTVTSVRFKIHRHVEYGQSLLIVGGIPELGTWGATNALGLNWGEGDNWTSDAVTMAAGASVEYKYVIRRKDGLDWCPGPNKAVALPAAAAVEVSDFWEARPSSVAVVTPVATEVLAAADMVVDEAAAVAAATADQLPTEVPLKLPELATFEANSTPSTIEESPSAVSTVENIELEEALDGLTAAAFSAAPTPGPAPHQPPPGFLANNIVQATPFGAIVVGPDPITEYEEADKYEVLDVGTGTAATATAQTPVAAARSMESMTVSELKSELKRRGMTAFGTRRELIIRLQDAGAL